jgi:hypothetical protein
VGGFTSANPATTALPQHMLSAASSHLLGATGLVAQHQGSSSSSSSVMHTPWSSPAAAAPVYAAAHSPPVDSSVSVASACGAAAWSNIPLTSLTKMLVQQQQQQEQQQQQMWMAASSTCGPTPAPQLVQVGVSLGLTPEGPPAGISACIALQGP